MTDLDAVDATLAQGPGSSAGRNIAHNQLRSGELRADAFDALEHTTRMAVRGVDTQHIDADLEQCLGPLQKITTDADGRTDPQPTLVVFASHRVFDLLHDVFDGDHARQPAVAIDNQDLLDAVFVEEFFGLFERGAFGHRDQVFAGHQLADGAGPVGLEAQVTVGDNAHQVAVGGGNGDARNAVFGHHVEGVTYRSIVVHRDGVGNHPVFGTFDLACHLDLIRNRQIFVDDADTTFTRHSNGQTVLGDRIHRGRDEGYIHADTAG